MSAPCQQKCWQAGRLVGLARQISRARVDSRKWKIRSRDRLSAHPAAVSSKIRCGCLRLPLHARAKQTESRRRDVRFTPESGHSSARSACRLCAKSDQIALQQNRLFDHLVSYRQQRRRYINADRPGGLEIDRQFELGRLHNGKIG
jgi:hypothetical protein